MFQKIELRKTRDFSAKINITFDFLRQNFRVLAISIAYISGPFIILQGIFLGLYQQKTLSMGGVLGGPTGFNLVGEVILWGGIGAIFYLLSYASTMVVVYEFLRLYETSEEPWKIEVADIWEGVKSTFFKQFLAIVLTAVITVFAFFFFVIPGLYVMICFSLVGPLLVIEGREIWEGINRCFKLITDKWWSTFGLLFVMSIIAGFMGFIFQIPQSILTVVFAMHKVRGELAEPALWEQTGILLTSVVASIGRDMLQPIVFVALGFQFYNLVERRESQGLLTKMESFGKAGTNAPQQDETY